MFVSFCHHHPGLEDQDLAFFDLARDAGFSVTLLEVSRKEPGAGYGAWHMAPDTWRVTHGAFLVMHDKRRMLHDVCGPLMCMTRSFQILS